MRRRWGMVWMMLAFSLALSALPSSAHAQDVRRDDDDASSSASAASFSPGERGAVTGIGTLMLTSTIGGILMGRARTVFARNAGVDVAGFGFAAAPLAGHLVNGEYARAAAFTAMPMAMAVGDVALMQREPNVLDEEGTSTTRVPFAIFFTVGLTSGVLGVVDTFFATPRRDRRDREKTENVLASLHFWPTFARDSGTLSVGGRW